METAKQQDQRGMRSTDPVVAPPKSPLSDDTVDSIKIKEAHPTTTPRLGSHRDGSSLAQGSPIRHGPGSDVALSADDQRSLSSDGDTDDGDLLVDRRSKMIDSIMKSFCATLDLKIATRKLSSTAVTVKSEHEAEPQKPIQDKAGSAQPGTVPPPTTRFVPRIQSQAQPIAPRIAMPKKGTGHRGVPTLTLGGGQPPHINASSRPHVPAPLAVFSTPSGIPIPAAAFPPPLAPPSLPGAGPLPPRPVVPQGRVTSDFRHRRVRSRASRARPDFESPSGPAFPEAGATTDEAAVSYRPAPPDEDDQDAFSGDAGGDVLCGRAPAPAGGVVPSGNAVPGTEGSYEEIGDMASTQPPSSRQQYRREAQSRPRLDDRLSPAPLLRPPRPRTGDQGNLVRPGGQLGGLLEESEPAQVTNRVAEPGHILLQGTLPEVDETADRDGRRKKAKRDPQDTLSGNKKFACPYFKRNPKKYRSWTSCPGPGWDEVHRVKTHLYRRHRLPIQCPRCWQEFKADGPLQLHLQQDPPCAIQGSRTLREGFTKDQEKRLRSRKKTHADMTDEDKWREIYVILFPDDDPNAIPSPFYSESDYRGGTGGRGGSGELEDYATFLRREMPTLVRRELEVLFRDEFRDVEERLRPRVADIILNLQPRLLSLYKQSQMPLSEYGPQQQHGDAASGSEPALTPMLSQGTDRTAGTGTDSTPAGMPEPDFLFDTADTQGGLFGSDMHSRWDAPPFGNEILTQPAEFVAELGLDWGLEFDKLLNTTLLMPQLQEVQTGPSGSTSAPLGE